MADKRGYTYWVSDEQLRIKTDEFRQRVHERLAQIPADDPSYEELHKQALKEVLDELLPQAFAVVREAGRRAVNMRHFDVQLVGGMVLHQGKIAEMKTGEGKTLVATCAAYLNALEGKGVHVVTVNDYLAKRDTQTMVGPIYYFLGHAYNDSGRTDESKQVWRSLVCHNKYPYPTPPDPNAPQPCQ